MTLLFDSQMSGCFSSTFYPFEHLQTWSAKMFPFLTADSSSALAILRKMLWTIKAIWLLNAAGRSNLTQSVIEAGGHGFILKHKTHLVLIAVWSEAMSFIYLASAAPHSIEDEDVFPANSHRSALAWRRPEIILHYDTVDLNLQLPSQLLGKHI